MEVWLVMLVEWCGYVGVWVFCVGVVGVRRKPKSTLCSASAASDVYERQG